MRVRQFFLSFLIFAPVLGAAQDGATARGLAVITESDVRRHINVIAADSMLGRDTPSRGLELTAHYVADHFRQLGLKPGGDNGTFLQRYPISTQKVSGSASSVRFQVAGVSAMASLARDARFISGARSGIPVTGPVVLLGGTMDSSSAAQRDVAGRVVLLVANLIGSMRSVNAMYAALMARRPAGVILVSNRASELFDEVVRRQFIGDTSMDPTPDDAPVGVEVHERALGAVLDAAGLDLATIRQSARPVFRAVPELNVAITVAGSHLTAPNSVGILEGTDPVLKHEYIVFSAHMDHVGVNPSSVKDSIWNGADDDASGTTGVMLLAAAFAKSPARRSIIFLTVSGEEKGLWGSEWFTTHPPVPMGQIVADLNLDMIGRNWRDTIVVIGKEHSDLGATLAHVNGLHPELDMSAVDDLWPQEGFYFRSDHYNFARRGVPILFFFNGTHEDYHMPGDSPDKINAEKESRVLKLVYLLGEQVGNAPARPKWNEESYRKIVR